MFLLLAADDPPVVDAPPATLAAQLDELALLLLLRERFIASIWETAER